MNFPQIVRRVVRYFSGKRALTVFSGAQGGRLTLDWFASILSADQEIKGNMRILRARSREMSRNNPVAKSFIKILLGNVLGERGIGYQAQVRNNDGSLNTTFNRKIEAAWKEWGKKGIARSTENSRFAPCAI